MARCRGPTTLDAKVRVSDLVPPDLGQLLKRVVARVDRQPHPKGHGIAARQVDREQRANECTDVGNLEHHRLACRRVTHPRPLGPLPVRKAQHRVWQPEANVPMMRRRRAAADRTDRGRHAPSIPCRRDRSGRGECNAPANVRLAHTGPVNESDSEPRPWDAAWAASRAGARWRAANPPPLSDQGPLRVRRTFPRLGIIVDPPPANSTPIIDATAARNAYTQSGARIYGSAGPTMHLAAMDEDKLVYLFHADSVTFPGHGPAGSESSDLTGPTLGVAVGLLDAMTGEWIRQVQSSDVDQ